MPKNDADMLAATVMPLVEKLKEDLTSELAHALSVGARSWAEVSNRALSEQAARLDHLEKRVDLMSVRLKIE
jgi:hypothetical protein